jgi:TonB family protein
VFFDTTRKSLLASLLIHGLLVCGYVIYIYEEPLKVASKEKIVTIYLKTLSLPKQNVEKPQPKPVVKPKPIKKVQEIKPTKTKQIVNKQMQQQAFIKTNFAIIRDMVLNNLEYPNIARKMGWQGVVKIKLVIDANGKFTHYEIVQSSNRKRLDNAAIEAVETLLNRILPKPKIKTSIILPISFQLQ